MHTAFRLAIATTLALAASLAAGCSGGSGGDTGPPLPVASFTTASGIMAEAGGTFVATVTIVTAGDDLASEVAIDVVDLGTGTATSGVDYVALPPTTLTFLAGSPSGTSQTVTLEAIADSFAEGANETVRIGLASPRGVQVGSPGAATIEIVDAQSAAVAFASATTVTPNESSSTYTIELVLTVGGTGALGEDITATLQDTGTGTATPGVDYAPITPLQVTFPAGSLDGATHSIDVEVIDDVEYEGVETVVLEAVLPEAVQDFAGTPMLHTLIITDDEVPPAANFAATEGPTGTNFPVANGDALSLGTQVSGAGPVPGTLFRVTNSGGGPMALGQPLLSGTNPNDFLVEVQSTSLPTARHMTPATAVEELDLASPLTRIARTGAEAFAAGPGVEAAFDPSALSDLEHAAAVRLHGWPLPGLGEVTLDLERVALPIAPDAVLAIDGVPVAGGPAALVGDLSLWRGAIAEVPGSSVFMALGAGGPEGFVRLPYGENGTIHVQSSAGANGGPIVARIVHEADVLALGASRPPLCSGVAHAPGALHSTAPEAPGTAALGGPGTAGAVVAPDCRVAIETDFQFYERFGSSAGLTNYVASLFGVLSDQYMEDVQTTLSIAYLGIHTTANDGWSAQDNGGDAGDVLAEFRAAWNSNGWPVSADLAHFLSGASLGGGIAYLNVLCNQSFGYGVSGNLRGNINWTTWTGAPGSFTWDYVVVAHELGHNFGAGHTHEYCPPIDVCATNCNGSTTCTQGTIMSYCHTCGGMDNIDLRFHQQIANVMRQRVQASCLGTAELQSGDYVQYQVRFSPITAAGAKTSTLSFTHDAPNAATPFTVTLNGTAQ